MKTTSFLLPALALVLFASAPAEARDRRPAYDVASAIAAGKAQGVLDGSVAFYFEGQASPRLFAEFGPASADQRTNVLGKPDDQACRAAMVDALAELQKGAKAKGADAVVGLRSNFKREIFSSATQYQCGVGRMMAGVALLGTYAKVADR